MLKTREPVDFINKTYVYLVSEKDMVLINLLGIKPHTVDDTLDTDLTTEEIIDWEIYSFAMDLAMDDKIRYIFCKHEVIGSLLKMKFWHDETLTECVMSQENEMFH